MRQEDFNLLVVLAIIAFVFFAFWRSSQPKRRKDECFSLKASFSELGDALTRLADVVLGSPARRDTLLEAKDDDEALAKGRKSHGFIGSGRSSNGVNRKKKKAAAEPLSEAVDAEAVVAKPAAKIVRHLTTEPTEEEGEEFLEDLGACPNSVPSTASAPSRPPQFETVLQRLGATLYTDIRPGKASESELEALVEVSRRELLDGTSLWDAVTKRNKLHVCAIMSNHHGKPKALGFAVHRMHQHQYSSSTLGWQLPNAERVLAASWSNPCASKRGSSHCVR